MRSFDEYKNIHDFLCEKSKYIVHGHIFTDDFCAYVLVLKVLRKLRNERNIQRKNNSIIIKTMLKS